MASTFRLGRRKGQTSVEYIVLVGGPSNTFNGYMKFVAGTWVPQPAPMDASPAEIDKYIYVNGVSGNLASTHDKYWAGFLYSAVRLFESGIVRPAPGDIVTFIIWIAPYSYRAATDWGASPYNCAPRPDHPFINRCPAYDKSFRKIDQGKDASPDNPFSRPAPIILRPPSQDTNDINFEINMRTIGEGEEGQRGAYRKRHYVPSMCLRAIHDLPGRLARREAFFGTWLDDSTPPIPGVQFKLLLARNSAEVLNYIKTGGWTRGVRWPHIREFLPSGNDTWSLDPNSHSWYASASRVANVPPTWALTPSVDRNATKILRFDYFGHSGSDSAEGGDALYVQYGWANAKGELPGPEVAINQAALRDAFQGSVAPSTSFAQLWGCRLGREMAQALAGPFSRVRATTSDVDYNAILSPAMPVPYRGGTWQSFTPGP